VTRHVRVTCPRPLPGASGSGKAIVLADRIAVLIDGQIRLWIEAAGRSHEDVRTRLMAELGVKTAMAR